VAGRVTVRPFRRPGGAARPLNGLGFHLGGSRGTQAGVLPSFRTSYGQVYFSYADGAAASGTHTRASPAVSYYNRSFGGFAEYMRSAQQVTHAGAATSVDNHAWEVTGSYVVTGEAASDRGVRPRHNFDPSAGQWGAVQVLARYTVLTVDRDAFGRGLAAAGASREARSWTLGVNWYPNPWIKWYANVERTVFDRGEPTPGDENVVFLRFQLGF
jgi:phosphate-selective porin OprO/OprP